jgi:DNA repair protein RecN (Recombination protein N)
MLSRLQISNYAIINELSTGFTKGLNIITGETGAGKSILAGALGLILGDRADSTVLLDKTRKCIVEGIFIGHDDEEVKAMFAELDIEAEQEIILRREISNNGKSRAFINDTPVNLGQLQKLASRLVDLHRQFDTLQLGEDHFQLQILDALAGHGSLRKEYSTIYSRFIKARQMAEQLHARRLEALKEYDYHQYLYTELEEAGFKTGELEQLEAELNLLSHSEQVSTAMANAEGMLDGGEDSIVRALKQVVQWLDSVEKFHAGVQPLAARLRSAQIDIKDISSELSQLSASIQMDEKRQDEVNERLSVGYKLLKKHNVSDTEALLKVKSHLQERINGVLDLDEEIKIADKALAQLDASARSLATDLTKGRKKIIPDFEKHLTVLLARVGMPNARLKVIVEPVNIGPSGADAVDFLFDANKSTRFESLKKVASGGELSRLLLCVKTMVAGSVQMPVLIFDEIDTGISGEAARQVGILMKEMGKNHQLLSITHQPQIAAKADNHFFVFKKEVDGAMRTQMRQLNAQERVEAIARMMSGEKPTQAALENAKELMEAAG